MGQATKSNRARVSLDDFEIALTNTTVGEKMAPLDIHEFLGRIQIALCWMEDIDPSYSLHKEAQAIVDLVGELPTNRFVEHLRFLITNNLEAG